MPVICFFPVVTKCDIQNSLHLKNKVLSALCILKSSTCKCLKHFLRLELKTALKVAFLIVWYYRIE